ncbi:MAG: hypothetical protein NTU88_05960 [Armatimonadetes bacterium]|nr:hypothetical protein [Armatimonadota bacterium]
MMRRILTVCAVLLATARIASANPLAAPEPMSFVTWIVRSITLNYTVDVLFLGLALWMTGQLYDTAWKLIPLYAVPVCIAGYAADFLAGLSGPVWQSSVFISEEVTGCASADPSADQVVFAMAAASALIFVLDAPLIALILRFLEADSYARVPYAAGIMAVATAPYVGLHGNVLVSALASTVLVTAILIAFCRAPVWIRTGRQYLRASRRTSS